MSEPHSFSLASEGGNADDHDLARMLQTGN